MHSSSTHVHKMWDMWVLFPCTTSLIVRCTSMILYHRKNITKCTGKQNGMHIVSNTVRNFCLKKIKHLKIQTTPCTEVIDVLFKIPVWPAFDPLTLNPHLSLTCRHRLRSISATISPSLVLDSPCSTKLSTVWR